MKRRSIYSMAPARGWLAWGLLAPFICILLALGAEFPTDFLLERLGLVDAGDDPRGTSGLIGVLLISFIPWGLLVAAWVALIERRSAATLGLVRGHAAPTFTSGALVGVASVGSVVAAAWLAGAYRAHGGFPAFQTPRALVDIVILLACFVVQASVEEFIFRGWLTSLITRRLNLLAAVVISSLLFALMHYTRGQAWLVTGNVVLFALFASAWAITSGNIWGVMGWHAGWNWLLATGFELPVTGLDAGVPALLVKLIPGNEAILTGGHQGPEGSIFCSLFFVAGIAYFVWRAARRGAFGDPGESTVPS